MLLEVNVVPSFLLVSVLSALTLGSALAQRALPQIEQSRQFDASGVPSLPPDEAVVGSTMPTFAAESPGDDDLGQQVILKSKNEYQPFSAFLGTEATYTSNVGLSDGFEQEDWFWRTTLGASYAPRFGNYLLGNISISQDVYRYDEFDALNFESLNLSAGLSYNLWFLYGINAGLEFNYHRLTSEGYGDEIFSNRTVAILLSRNFVLSRAHYFYVSGSAEFGWSDPEQAARDEFSLLGGYHLRLTRNFELDLFYRLGFYHYSEVDRDDVNQTVQLSGRYNFTKWLTATASISGTFNESDRQGFDYEVFNTNIGGYISWKF